PNQRALWLRISNTIESEYNFNSARAAHATGETRVRREGFWTRLAQRRWELTLPQMTAAVAAIVVTVSLVTTLGLQSFQAGAVPAEATAASKDARNSNALVADEYYPRGYVDRQQASINYWQQRVEQRKASWNPRMRDSFDRSIVIIDEAVADSLEELQRNPHDEVSEEMLNAALRQKVELLKEFCEH
ncbi:MAG TPA: hypothetical protein VF754_01750, partial [Pyrinomonadaceae bacterium]